MDEAGVVMEEEIWKPIPGYEGIYEASSLGRIRSLNRKEKVKGGCVRFRESKILTPRRNNLRGGYLELQLCKEGKSRTFKVHRLVMLAFAGEPPEGKTEVDHIDGDRENNRIENLEYVSKKENYMRMAENQGRFAFASRLEELEQRVAELEAKLGGKDDRG
jgi:hypothetical protein